MIKNATIRSTMLGREDHGIMTFMLYVDTGSFLCGIGGFELDEYDKNIKARVFRTDSMEIVSEILDVVGVDKWEDLTGKHIRIGFDEGDPIITKIGNIINDKWLDMREFFRKDKENNNA